MSENNELKRNYQCPNAAKHKFCGDKERFKRCIEFEGKRKANKKDQTPSLDLIFNLPHP